MNLVYADLLRAGVDDKSLREVLMAPLDLAEEVPDEAILRKETDDFTQFVNWQKQVQK